VLKHCDKKSVMLLSQDLTFLWHICHRIRKTRKLTLVPRRHAKSSLVVNLTETFSTHGSCISQLNIYTGNVPGNIRGDRGWVILFTSSLNSFFYFCIINWIELNWIELNWIELNRFKPENDHVLPFCQATAVGKEVRWRRRRFAKQTQHLFQKPIHCGQPQRQNHWGHVCRVEHAAG